MIVGASCTAELIQDDPGGLAKALNLPVPVIALELPAYQKKENWGAAETFYRLVRGLTIAPSTKPAQATCNILGPSLWASATATTLSKSKSCCPAWGIAVNVTAPMGATPADLVRLGEAHFNVVLYPEIAEPAARHLEKTFGQKSTKVIPIGVSATREFVAEVAALAGVDPSPVLDDEMCRLPWYSRSVDSTYLTGKRGLYFWRRHPRHRSGPYRQGRARL